MIIVKITKGKYSGFKTIKVLCASSCKNSCSKFDFLWFEYGHMF